MRQLLLDTSVLVLAHGRPHPQREASHSILDAAHRQLLRLHLSTEAIQEFVRHRMRVTHREEAVDDARLLMESAVLHAFDEQVLARAIDLIGTTSIRGRDAVHAATALEHGFTEIVTTDGDFAAVPGLTPITPDQLQL